MSTAQSVSGQIVSSTSYERMVRRGMAVACFLFPLLFLVAAVFHLAGSREYYQNIGWVSSNEAQVHGYSWLAWYAGIPAMLGVVRLIQDKMPRLAFWSAVFVLIGGMSQLAEHRALFNFALLRQVGLEVYWNTPHSVAPPIYFWAITVVLWMIGLIQLGIGVWRTGVLPKWVGALLQGASLGVFLAQGPTGLVPAIPPIAFQVTNICFLLAFPMVGMKLWRGETAVN